MQRCPRVDPEAARGAVATPHNQEQAGRQTKKALGARLLVVRALFFAVFFDDAAEAVPMRPPRAFRRARRPAFLSVLRDGRQRLDAQPHELVPQVLSTVPREQDGQRSYGCSDLNLRRQDDAVVALTGCAEPGVNDSVKLDRASRRQFRLFDQAVDLRSMVEVVEQRRMDVFRSQARKLDEDLVEVHSELMGAHDGRDRYSRSFDSRCASAHLWIAVNVRIRTRCRLSHCFIPTLSSSPSQPTRAAARRPRSLRSLLLRAPRRGTS